MIYFLRNISIRLWISVTLAIPAAFIISPAMQRIIPNMSPPILSMLLMISLFIVTGYIMNIAAERAIYSYINDAKNWERDGVFNKSEACYLKAIELFDSYLLTALISKKTALPLTGAIARFSLTASWHNDHFDMATTFFLQKNPHETEVAQLWLKKMVKRKSIIAFSSQEETLLTLLAELEPLAPQLVPLLSEIFKKNRRSDFAAKRVFSIINGNEISEEESLSAFERAVECSEISESGKERKLSRTFGDLEEIEKLTLINQYQTDRPFLTSRRRGNIRVVRKQNSSFLPYIIKSALSYIFSLGTKGVIWISSLPMNMISLFIRIIQIIFRSVASSFKRIHNALSLHQELRKNTRRVMVLILMTGGLLLILNTLSHLFHTSAPPPPTTPKILAENVEPQVIPQKKFTIQVAAYLSQFHAEQYLTNLEKKGWAGGKITAVEGGGKIWYLIRVGEYETKERATAYGNKLKSQGVINDFFVDNIGV